MTWYAYGSLAKTAIDWSHGTTADFDRGVADLHRTAEADGVFCYTFFKARAVKAPLGAPERTP